MGERVWLGKPPSACDICRRPILRTFVDGRTRSGQWAIMCPTCRVDFGPAELGVGRGQKYEAQGAGETRKWIKTGG